MLERKLERRLSISEVIREALLDAGYGCSIIKGKRGKRGQKLSESILVRSPHTEAHYTVSVKPERRYYSICQL